MNKTFALLTAALAIAVTSAVAGVHNPAVGGHEMYPTKNIIEKAVNSADHTTLVAAVRPPDWSKLWKARDRSPSSPPPTKPSRKCRPAL